MRFSEETKAANANLISTLAENKAIHIELAFAAFVSLLFVVMINPYFLFFKFIILIVLDMDVLLEYTDCSIRV